MFWWVRFIFFSAAAVFFLEFGIREMIRAIALKTPTIFWVPFSPQFHYLISATFLWPSSGEWSEGKEKTEERGKGKTGKG